MTGFMSLKQVGGWWHVQLTHKGKRYNINTMEQGAQGEINAGAYEKKLRTALQSHNVGPMAAAVSGGSRQPPPEQEL